MLINRFVAIKKNKNTVILQRLLLSFIADTTVRSLKTSTLLSTSYSVDSRAGGGPLASLGGSSALAGRHLSPAYKLLFDLLRPAEMSPAATTPTKMDAAIKTSTDPRFKDLIQVGLKARLSYKAEAYTGKALELNVATLCQQYDTFAFMTSYFDKARTDAAMSSSPTNAEKNAVNESLVALYSATDVMSVLSAITSLKTSLPDPDNAFSLNATWADARPDGLTSTHLLKNYTDRFFITNGTEDDSSHLKNAPVPGLLAMEVVIPRIGADGDDFSITDVMDFVGQSDSAGHKADASVVSALYTYLTDYEVLTGLPACQTLYDDLMMIQDKFVSDDKDIDRLYKASMRVQDLVCVRLFYALQGWVALLQVALRPYNTASLLEHFETRFPALAGEYDIKTILGMLSGLPVGKNTASVMRDFPIYTDMTVQGTSYGVLERDSDVTDAAVTLMTMLARLHALSKRMYGLTKQKDLWDMYNRGGEIAGKASLSFKTYNLKDEGMAVSTCQFGVFAGDTIRTIDEFSHSMVVDMGLNRYNASAMSEYLFSDSRSTYAPEPLVYGTVKHKSYWSMVQTGMRAIVDGGGMISGAAFASLHSVLVPIKKHVRDTSTIDMMVERDYVRLGSASALPVSAAGFHPLATDMKLSMVNKNMYGSYVTTVDQMPLPIVVVPANILKDAPLAFGSLLPTYLNTAMSQFKGDAAVNVPIFKRYVHAKDPSRLASNGIIADDLFHDSISCIYYMPARFLSTAIDMVRYSVSFNDSVEEDSETKAMSVIVGPTRILAANSLSEILRIPNGRLVGSTLYFDAGYGHQSPDDKLISI
jgi:hypothetical protein